MSPENQLRYFQKRIEVEKIIDYVSDEAIKTIEEQSKYEHATFAAAETMDYVIKSARIAKEMKSKRR